MRQGRRGALAVGGALIAAALAARAPLTAQRAGPRLVAVTAETPAALRPWDEAVDALLRGGELRRRDVRADPLLPGRIHERLDQYHRGVRVEGGQLTRQLDGPLTVSIFGHLYTELDLDPQPALDIDAARAAIARAAGEAPPSSMTPELVVWPTRDRGYALAYRGYAPSGVQMMLYVVDARTGELLAEEPGFQPQVVGKGRGVHNDEKKLSVRQLPALFLTDDRLRPPAIVTYDMKGDLSRTQQVVFGRLSTADADIASDTDNEWTDGAVVDAHAYAGWFYDYLFKRFSRRGIDDRDLRILTFVHPVRLADIGRADPSVVGLYYLNAFYCRTCGTDGRGVVVFGEGAPAGFIPGVTVHNFAGALDVVAHELMHAVTAYTSGIGGIGEGGSLNEALSDIAGTAVEFFYQPAGNGPLRADYWVGEDLTTPPAYFSRSLRDPGEFGQPDHYSRRNPARGVHYNSTIMSHAFYLAVEGGVNRTSGRAVAGVGAANREQVERIFYRAFAFLMPAAGTFALARATTLQAARDLYGPGSAAERAIAQAWDAVGVDERTSPTVSFSPNPVPGRDAPCAGVAPSWTFTTTLSAARSGLTVTGWTVDFFDSGGATVSTQTLTAADFVRFFGACGPPSTRVPPQADACASLCVSLGGRTSGFVVFTFETRDDEGHAARLASERLRLLAPLAPPATTAVTDEGRIAVASPWAGQ